MTKKPDDWMPLIIGKYLSDTTHLTTLQHGAYFLLLLAYWRRGGPLPADDGRLAATAKVSPAEWKKLRPVMAEFFVEHDGVWSQKRADEELAKAKRLTEAKAEAGRKGAKNKWQTHGIDDDKAVGETMAQPSASHRQTGRQTDAPLPLPSPVEVPIAKAIGRQGAEILEFAGKPEWWPKRDRYGRVISPIDEKILYDTGKTVLGKSSGGQITKLLKFRPYQFDRRAAIELLLRADEASDPASWFAAALRKAEIDEPEMSMHEKFPEQEYRA